MPVALRRISKQDVTRRPGATFSLALRGLLYSDRMSKSLLDDAFAHHVWATLRLTLRRSSVPLAIEASERLSDVRLLDMPAWAAAGEPSDENAS